MTTREAIAMFGGSARKMAEALGISTSAVYQWGATVPPRRAYEIRDIINATVDRSVHAGK